MGCCGKDDDDKQQGWVKERKCRDVLCLLIFLAFWAGMFIICGIAAKKGDPNRLLYGIDAYGFTCGSKNTIGNITLDLRDYKNLYYLNALDLLNPADISFAKSVCVAGCPTVANMCNITTMPCTSDSNFQAPYYLLAQHNLYGKLSGVTDESTSWYGSLTSMAPATDSMANATIQALSNANMPWVQQYMTQYNIIQNPSQTVDGHYYQLTSQMPAQGPAYPIWLPTSEYFHRCFPDIPADWASSAVSGTGSSATAVGSEAASAFKDKFNSVSEQWKRYVASISKGILIIIVGGLCGGLVLSLVWMLILRYAAGLMAWTTIVAVNVALLGVTLYAFSFAGFLSSSGVGQAISDHLPQTIDPSTLDRSTWKWIAIAAAVVAGLVLLLTLLCISRVRVAVACIKVASQAVGAMPSIMLFPIVPFMFEVGLIVYWIAITALLYSAGELTTNCRDPVQPVTFASLSGFTAPSTPTPANMTSAATGCYANLTMEGKVYACAQDPDCYISYKWDSALTYSFIYHFFGLLWTNQFLVGFACVTTAGAIGSYYWNRGDTSEMPAMPVVTAMKNTTIYHLGSIAFGSFIIACIQLIRFLLEYLDRKTKALQAGNCAAQWAMCCVKCCMWCLEKIMAFINRNAYIMVGIKGTNYCASATRAITLVVSNALRLAVVNVIGDLLLFLGKIAIAATCGIIAFAMSTLPYYTDPAAYPDTYIGSPVLPVALSIITGYVVAEIFFAVYEMAIDTIMLSFCEDCERNGGTPRFAPPLLMEVMGAEAAKPISN